MLDFDNVKTMNELRSQAYEALREGNEEEQDKAFNALFEGIGTEAKQAAENKTSELYSAINDEQVLINRGVSRAMTSEEKKYFNEAVKKQTLEGLDNLFPKTIIQDIFKDLTKEHPIISKVDTQYTEAVLEYIYGDPTKQTAFWGALPDDIRQILLGAFKSLKLQVAKLSGFIATPKSYFQLGPDWLAQYVTTALRESITAALEDAIVNGDGKTKPLGMTRKLSGSTDGVYPLKETIAVANFKPATLAGIRATMAKEKTDNGAVEWLVNPETYWAKFYPNLAFQTPTGAWVTTTLPTGETITLSEAVPKDMAVVGVLKNYLLAVAGELELKLYDQTLAIEDMDLYIAKMFATGISKNANAFFVADVSSITGATPATPEAKADVKAEDNINPRSEEQTTPEV